jgi:hypothetical protein
MNAKKFLQRCTIGMDTNANRIYIMYLNKNDAHKTKEIKEFTSNREQTRRSVLMMFKLAFPEYFDLIPKEVVDKYLVKKAKGVVNND